MESKITRKKAGEAQPSGPKIRGGAEKGSGSGTSNVVRRSESDRRARRNSEKSAAGPGAQGSADLLAHRTDGANLSLHGLNGAGLEKGSRKRAAGAGGDVQGPNPPFAHAEVLVAVPSGIGAAPVPSFNLPAFEGLLKIPDAVAAAADGVGALLGFPEAKPVPLETKTASHSATGPLFGVPEVISQLRVRVEKSGWPRRGDGAWVVGAAGDDNAAQPESNDGGEPSETSGGSNSKEGASDYSSQGPSFWPTNQGLIGKLLGKKQETPPWKVIKENLERPFLEDKDPSSPNYANHPVSNLLSDAAAEHMKKRILDELEKAKTPILNLEGKDKWQLRPLATEEYRSPASELEDPDLPLEELELVTKEEHLWGGVGEEPNPYPGHSLQYSWLRQITDPIIPTLEELKDELDGYLDKLKASRSFLSKFQGRSDHYDGGALVNAHLQKIQAHLQEFSKLRDRVSADLSKAKKIKKRSRPPRFDMSLIDDGD